MNNDLSKEVQEVLTTPTEDITFETPENENSSPLNQPVKEKDIGGESTETSDRPWNVWKPDKNKTDSDTSDTSYREVAENAVHQQREEEPLDAPEQPIGNDTESEADFEATQNEYEIPIDQANLAADALLGMTNNLLEVGGGFFVKIRKHEEFYEFEEVIQIIEKQNTKNVQRIKLDQEDLALLRPLLAQVLRKKAKKLTPEQQLLGAIFSILMKKAQTVLEIRAENTILEHRILEIIRQEKQTQEVDVTPQEEEEEQTKQEQQEIITANTSPENNTEDATSKQQKEMEAQQVVTPLAASVLEVADEK